MIIIYDILPPSLPLLISLSHLSRTNYSICLPTEKDTSWQPEKEPVGFFPAPATAKYAPLPPPPRDAPIKRDGVIPNSVLARILWPLPPEAEKEEREYRPPVFNKDMEDELEAARDKVSGGLESWHKGILFKRKGLGAA